MKTWTLSLMAALAVLASSADGQTPYTVVMTGLDNPRGMAFAPNGALYVTEAGRGGPGPSHCGYNGAGELRCYGPTGAITRLWKGQQSRVAEGMPSHATPDGSTAGGPNDISFQGTGGAYITLGLGGGPQLLEDFGSELLGTLIHMPASGKWKVVADIALHEFDENPAGGPLDSNPYGVLAEPAGRLVVDAGANALLSVAPNGKIQTLAVFPAQPNPVALRSPHGRKRPDLGCPRPRRRPLCRAAYGLSVCAGPGQHLSGRSGTEPGGALPRIQDDRRHRIRTGR